MGRSPRMKDAWENHCAIPLAQGSAIVAGHALPQYIAAMTFISIKDAQLNLADLAARIERGETIVVTQDGRPVFDLVPHKAETQPAKKEIDFEAGREYLRSRGIIDPVRYIAEDFDDPLPEDFLITPSLPE